MLHSLRTVFVFCSILFYTLLDSFILAVRAVAESRRRVRHKNTAPGRADDATEDEETAERTRRRPAILRARLPSRSGTPLTGSSVCTVHRVFHRCYRFSPRAVRTSACDQRASEGHKPLYKIVVERVGKDTRRAAHGTSSRQHRLLAPSSPATPPTPLHSSSRCLP